MKHVYNIHIRPGRYAGLALLSEPALTGEGIAGRLAGAVVSDLITTEFGDYVADVELQRPSHEEALDGILVAIEQLGYTVVGGTITEWADEAARGAVIGALGGGAVGSEAGNIAVGLLAAAAGLLTGAIAGSFVQKSEIIYHVRPGYPSGWVLTPVPAAESTQAAGHLGLAST